MSSTNELLYCFKLEDPSGEFEPAAGLLEALEVDFDSRFDRESRQVWHTVYSTEREMAEAALDLVKHHLKDWSEFGVELVPGEIFELHSSEWAEAWKKYFKPIEISDKLLIRPSWLNDPAKPGQAVLTIDPGMSFGTGQHATTFFCLKQIDRFASSAKSMLDAGCGSGILAIAAALRGYEHIDAFDFDPDAVSVAVENIALNDVTKLITPTVADAADYPGREEKYDLVCANILGHLLITFRFNIVRWIKPGGILVLAGILEKDFDKVSSAFTALGLEEIERETLREWTSGVFRMPTA